MADTEELKELLSHIGGLKHEDPSVRAYSAEQLGLIGDKHAVPYLIEALSDPVSDVRKGVLFALSMVNDPRAFEPALKMIDDADQRIREEVYRVLWQADGKKAIDILIKAAEKETEPSLRKLIATALMNIVQDEPERRILEHLKKVQGSKEFENDKEFGHRLDKNIRWLERFAIETKDKVEHPVDKEKGFPKNARRREPKPIPGADNVKNGPPPILK